jgi:ribonuclease HI
MIARKRLCFTSAGECWIQRSGTMRWISYVSVLFTCTKLRHILLFAEIIVICKSDIIKHMLSAPVLKCRLGNWMFALSEFDIRYQPAKAVKGQALVDLIAERINTNIATLSIWACAMYFDGSACEDGCGIGILLVSPRGVTYSFSIRLPAPCTNNLGEYQAVHRGMVLLVEAGAEAVEVFGDSKLVISQLMEEYRCESELLFLVWMQCHELMTCHTPFREIGNEASIRVPRMFKSHAWQQYDKQM